jgi:hypothetical protein
MAHNLLADDERMLADALPAGAGAGAGAGTSAGVGGD